MAILPPSGDLVDSPRARMQGRELTFPRHHPELAHQSTDLTLRGFVVREDHEMGFHDLGLTCTQTWH